MRRKELPIGVAAQRFDQQGNLTDEQSKQLITQLLQNLIKKTLAVKRAEAGVA